MTQGAAPPVYRPPFNPMAFFNTSVNQGSSSGGGGAYSGDPGISYRPIPYWEDNPFGRNYADASNSVSSVTPDMMFNSLTGFFGNGQGSPPPAYQPYTPNQQPYQAPPAYQNTGAYQGYTAGAFSGPQVSAPGAWGGYDINAPGAWDPSFTVDAGLTDTQDAINAQLPWIAEQRDLGFADAAARAGQSGFAMSSPYMESLGGVARNAANDTQAMAEQFLFQAEESARQRDLQAQMQRLQLEKEAWQNQGDWQMAEQIQEAQNSLSSWQTEGGWNMGAQMSNQQTALGAYQTQESINAQNAFNQNSYNMDASQMANQYGMESANMANQYGLDWGALQNQAGIANSQGASNQTLTAWQTQQQNYQNWMNQMMGGMFDMGYGGG